MKFTLLSNDNELSFKLKQYWDAFAPKTLINNSYCYKHFSSFIKFQQLHFWDGNYEVFELEISKGKGKITYEIEDMQLDFKGSGKKIKIISIEVNANEKTNKAKIKIKAQRENSLSEKLSNKLSIITNKIHEKHKLLEQNKIKKINADKVCLKNIIEKKVKETITDEY